MPLERFIPFRKRDVANLCEGLLSHDSAVFRTFSTLLVSRIHYQYHEQLEALKNSYSHFDPNKDTRELQPSNERVRKQNQKAFAKGFASLLNAANFEKVTDDDLEAALNEESLFKVRLAVSFDDFEDVVFYRRGDSIKTETVRTFFGLRKKQVSFTNYDKVAVYITFKDEAYFKEKGQTPVTFKPGSTIVKLFQNVPKADLEMLFPNSEVKMRPLDKLIISASAAIGGTVVLVTKLGASLLLMASFLAFWLGFKDDEVELTKQSLITFGIGMGVFGSFIFKEWTKFKNRKIRFMKALSDNLYFKNLDNNAGVFHTLIDAAEEEDSKEALLAYTFLLKCSRVSSEGSAAFCKMQSDSEIAAGGMTLANLDSAIETYFLEELNCALDFDVTDAIEKLVSMQLVEQNGDVFVARTLKDAVKILDDFWDNIYQPV
ncbi:TMEM143 family protein [Alteromonas macleodii]|uniref:DUF3754 domain-containing protein n=1 Tax=Alteromonas macleodii TaxID=28108 RepID=A0A6T9XWI6_ALTMA|nr:TMEM143 family protein [Alteromonas macleodii]CAB9492860.1 conserved protein of unknown function [Alteromonas macleodii]